MNKKPSLIHILILISMSLAGLIFLFIFAQYSGATHVIASDKLATTSPTGSIQNLSNSLSSERGGESRNIERTIENINSSKEPMPRIDYDALFDRNKSNILPPVSVDLLTNQFGSCKKGVPVRKFNIEAIQIDIVYNNFGDHDPNAKMYALEEDVDNILESIEENPGKPIKEIQPLTIRANKGDCIEVTFSNALKEKASIHINGINYDVHSSDGTAVGYNSDSTVSPNSETFYRWYAEEEGIFLFYNGADMTYYTDPTGGKGTMGDGLFGALIVEPVGARWTDPLTGEELKSGLYANIELPNQPDFREFSIFLHDGVGAVSGNKKPPFPSMGLEENPEADLEQPGGNENHEGESDHQEGTESQESEVVHSEEVESHEHNDEHPEGNDTDEDGMEKELYAVNYRAEPLEERVKNALTEDGKDPTMFYSSWVYGEPATPINLAYVGDPVRYRIIGANSEENHVFHLHGNRWKSDTRKTNTVDSETLNIGDAQTAELANGAGYVIDGKGAPGDYLWHCHLFPHYLQGMWGLLRVFDKAHPDLLPLKDREPPPKPTKKNPGFPQYIPGELGKRAPKPPDPELRPPTAQERETFNALVPGAPNIDRCPRNAPVRNYHIVGLQKDIVYNSYGDHDREGRMYVLKEDEEKVLNGELRPRPLVIRANQGDCVEVTLENHLFNVPEPNAISMHIHYVAYDPLGSDGTAVGWNYNQGTRPGEKIRYRWYADEEGNIFFHDHMSAGEKGFHGTFGALIVEPKGSKWLHPKTGLEINSGTEAIIVRPDREDFREQVLIYHDFSRLWDKNGHMLPLESDPANVHKAHGYTAVNYSNAPFFRRNNADPAYVFSSWVHGDPDTPIIESYPGDPIKIRLIQGAHEAQHNFNLHGLHWKIENSSQNSEITSTQTIGMSEQFTMDIQPNPVGVKQRDYLWSSQPIEDLWSGLWGFVRIWGEQNESLQKLPDRAGIKEKVNRERVTRMIRGGETKFRAQKPGNVCPRSAPVKKYAVTAFMKDIQYNKSGDHDPFGIMFALSPDVDPIMSGQKTAEPLVIRANVGDCIQVTLSNKLPLDPPENQNDPDLLMADQVQWKNSNRVSLHPQMVQYDVQGSDGASIGFNHDQTIAPGEKITYHWYADQEYGGTILYDYGDIRSHRLHGAYGALIIEPKGSKYRDPKTGEGLKSGARADIIVPNQPDFREQVLMFSDGLYTIGKDGSSPTPGEFDPVTGDFLDLEDRGEKGINYSSEPFKHRLAFNLDKSLIFSSIIHGDPSTPMPEAYLGDPIRLRVMQTADRSRGSVFTLHSHRWRYQWTDPNSKLVSSQGSLTPGTSLDILPIQNKEFPSLAGDYLYREMKLRRYLEGGLWGILRIHDQPKNQLLSLPDRIPQPPINVKVDRSSKTVSWNAENNKNLMGYNIYRKSVSNQNFIKINQDVIQALSYIDEEKLKDNKYSYKITAVDIVGNESGYSKEVTIDRRKGVSR